MSCSHKISQLFFISVTLFSCSNSENGQADIVIGKNSDTQQVIHRYPNNGNKYIIYYRYNQPQSSLGFSEEGDTLKVPKAVYARSSDSLFVFIPINQFEGGYAIFGDSAGFSLTRKEYSVYVTKSCMLKIVPEMLSDSNKIVGVFKFPLRDGLFEFFPFETKRK